MAIPNSQVVFSPISDSAAYFPEVSTKKGRNKYHPALNETPLLIDHVFSESDNSVAIQEEHLSEDFIIHRYKDMIKQHIERRILFSFQQAITTYKTMLLFDMSEALDQGNSPKKITLEDQSKQIIAFQRNAAHSCTLPCLIIQSLSGEATKRFVFLKNTDLYRICNATMNMPRWVNNADILIDGTSKTHKLRIESIDQINRCSTGEISPAHLLKIFCKALLTQIETSIVEAGENPEKHVLNLYQSNVRRFIAHLNSCRTPTITSLLDMHQDSLSLPKLVRKTIIDLRYLAIRDSAIEQSKIMLKIEQVRAKIWKSFKGKKPNHLEAAFRTLLIEPSENDTINLSRIRKLFNFSPESFSSLLAPSSHTMYEASIEKLREEHLQEISDLRSEIVRSMEDLKRKEEESKGTILHQIRLAYNWSFEDLAENIHDLFPDSGITQDTIASLEAHQTSFTTEIENQLCKAFQIDFVIFSPHFFFS